MAISRKTKQSKRALPGRIKGADPLSRARRQHGKTPKKNSLHGTTSPKGRMPKIDTAEPRVPGVAARRAGRLKIDRPRVAAKTARAGSKTEEVALSRSTRYTSGISSGGQTGNKRIGGSSPSRGRRGSTPKHTPR